MAVCPSVCPSPVMTRSAPFSSAAKPTASSTSSTPGRKRAGVKKRSPAPSPPAAPAPGRSATSARPVAARGHLGEAVERRVELLHRLRRRPLLRAVDRRGAARPAQRVVHVAGDDEVAGGEARVEPARSMRASRASAAPPSGSSSPAPSRKRTPRRPRDARSAVVGGAPADADHHAPLAGVEGGADELARAARAGEPGVAARLGGTSGSPEAAAISTTAVTPSPSTPKRASSPARPAARTRCARSVRPPVTSTSASTVPSPPSAMEPHAPPPRGRRRARRVTWRGPPALR